MKVNTNLQQGHKRPTVIKTLSWVTAFAIAMGFLESAVVIYLRELYYKDGFSFPLKPMDGFVGRVEFIREAATVIMLIAAGILAGSSRLQRFAYFVLAFAIWDVFYYVFLYVFLHWPSSFNTWDILFLIPVPWVGPVWAPCLLCALMVLGALHVIVEVERDVTWRVPLNAWLPLLSGTIICITAFMWDCLRQRSAGGLWWMGQGKDLFDDMSHYVPTAFNLPLFLIGFVLMCWPVFQSLYQTNLKKQSL